MCACVCEIAQKEAKQLAEKKGKAKNGIQNTKQNDAQVTHIHVYGCVCVCSRGSNIAASLRRCDADAEPQRHRHCQYKRRSKDAKCSFRRRFVSFLYVRKNSNIKSQQNNKMKHTTKAAAAAITHTLTRTHVCRIQRFFSATPLLPAAAPPLNVNVNVDGDAGGEYKSFNSLRTRVY